MKHAPYSRLVVIDALSMLLRVVSCFPCFHACTEYSNLIEVAVETGQRSNEAPVCTGKTRDVALMNQPVVYTAGHSFSRSFLDNSKQCNHVHFKRLPNYNIMCKLQVNWNFACQKLSRYVVIYWFFTEIEKTG